MAVLSRVTYNGEFLGDYAFVNIDFVGNTTVRIIPRALGVKIYATEELGGGQLIFKVRLVVLKTSRQDIVKYQESLYQLGNGPSDLVVYDKTGLNPVVFEDCYLNKISSPSEDELWSWIDIELTKSI